MECSNEEQLNASATSVSMDESAGSASALNLSLDSVNDQQQSSGMLADDATVALPASMASAARQNDNMLDVTEEGVEGEEDDDEEEEITFRDPVCSSEAVLEEAPQPVAAEQLSEEVEEVAQAEEQQQIQPEEQQVAESVEESVPAIVQAEEVVEEVPSIEQESVAAVVEGSVAVEESVAIEAPVVEAPVVVKAQNVTEDVVMAVESAETVQPVAEEVKEEAELIVEESADAVVESAPVVEVCPTSPVQSAVDTSVSFEVVVTPATIPVEPLRVNFPSDSLAGLAAIDSSVERIQVGLRVRPLNARELSSGQTAVFRTYPKSNSIGQTVAPHTNVTVDSVFDESASNDDVYVKMAQPIVHSATRGINGTLFAYGQTSSGKTFTMRGIIAKAVEEVFQIAQQHSDRTFTFNLSYIEIYNEKIKDLLAASSTSSTASASSNVNFTDLQIREDIERGVFIGGLREESVSSKEQIHALLTQGEAMRHVGATAMNEHSSRSHTIFRLAISSRSTESNNSESKKFHACLQLVDLAGSERATQTQAKGVRLKEGGHINKSLLTLASVIRKLGEDPKGHIPYRDSKLTRILQPSLGGNNRTAVICCVTSASAFTEETLSTMRFAARAKNVVNQIKINEEVDSNVAAGEEANLIKKLRTELASLKRKLRMSDGAALMGKPSVASAALADLQPPSPTARKRARPSVRYSTYIPSTFEDEVDDRTAVTASAAAANTSMEEESVVVSTNIAASQESVQALHEMYRAQIQSLEAKLAAQEPVAVAASEPSESSAAEIQQLKEKVAAFQSKLSLMSAAKASLQTQLSHYESIYNGQSLEWDGMKKEFYAMRDTIEQFESIKEIDLAIVEEQSSRVLEAAEKKIENLSQENKSKTSQIQELLSARAVLNQHLATLQAQVTEMEQLHQSQLVEAQESAFQVILPAIEVVVQADEQGQVEHGVDVEMQTDAMPEPIVVDHSEQMQEMAQELEAARTKLSSSESQSASLNQRLSEVESQLSMFASVRAELVATKQSLAAKQSEVVDLSERLTTLENENDKLQKQIPNEKTVMKLIKATREIEKKMQEDAEKTAAAIIASTTTTAALVATVAAPAAAAAVGENVSAPQPVALKPLMKAVPSSTTLLSSTANGSATLLAAGARPKLLSLNSTATAANPPANNAGVKLLKVQPALVSASVKLQPLALNKTAAAKPLGIMQGDNKENTPINTQ